MPEFDENKVLRDALEGLNEEVPPMPEGLHAAWMQKVEEDGHAGSIRKTLPLRTVTRWLSVAAALLFVVGGTLLTRDELLLQAKPAANEQAAKTRSASYPGTAYANTYSADLAYDMDDAVVKESAAADNGIMLTGARSMGSDALPAPEMTEKKIIRTASLTIATRDFDSGLESLRQLCQDRQGWIESSSEHTNRSTDLRTAYLTLRIPQTALDDCLTQLEGLGRITHRSETAADVTESYQDTQARLTTQTALMDRLQALITESGDLSDLLALESQIAETQYTIDRLQSALNSTDRQVTYSTLDITLAEEATVPLTDSTVTFSERILSALKVGVQSLAAFAGDVAVFLMAALPFLVILVVALILVRLTLKRRRK